MFKVKPKEMISLYAVGDVGPEREEPNLAFAKCLSTLREADIRFCQLEKCYRQTYGSIPGTIRSRQGGNLKGNT